MAPRQAARPHHRVVPLQSVMPDVLANSPGYTGVAPTGRIARARALPLTRENAHGLRAGRCPVRALALFPRRHRQRADSLMLAEPHIGCSQANTLQVMVQILMAGVVKRAR